MAPQDGFPWRQYEEDFEYSRNLKDNYLRTSSTPASTPKFMATPTFIDVEVEVPPWYKTSLASPSWRPLDYTQSPGSPQTSIPTLTTRSKYTLESLVQTPAAISSTVTDTSFSPTATADGFEGDHHPPGPPPQDDNEGMIAAAAIIPVTILAILGFIVFFCLRRRRRQQAATAARTANTQEMKQHGNTRSVPNAHAYVAPPPTIAPHYAYERHHRYDAPPYPTTSQTQPVILGPIPSGVNGAYLTGMDTSDVVSVTSANHLRPGPVDPFADNNSLSEPPPPYRPRSIAPPSFMTNSRQSSMRSTAPPTTSQTHLIGRSPFDDPVDDDNVSQLSGPTAGRGEDNMSAVSDLSYQNEPHFTRSSI